MRHAGTTAPSTARSAGAAEPARAARRAHAAPDPTPSADLPGEPDSHVLRCIVTDVPLPDDGGVLALLTLTAADEHRPTTLGPRGLDVLHTTLRTLRDRAAAGEIVAVAVTGRPGCFVAGADLTVARRLRGLADTRGLAVAGHAALRLLGELPVPTFAWITGHALGGGLELALHCDHRVAVAGIRSLGLPEASLGIVPGWGGCWLLPRIVGLPAAIDLAVLRPLAGNRLTTAEQALEVGLVDAVLPAEGFAQAALGWTAGRLRAAAGRADGGQAEVGHVDAWLTGTERSGAGQAGAGPAGAGPAGAGPAGTGPAGTGHAGAGHAGVGHAGVDHRRGVPPLVEGAPDPVARAAATIEARLHGTAPAYARVLTLLTRAGTRDRDAGFAAEDAALAALLMSDEARASLYAADLTGPGARRDLRSTTQDAAPREVRSVGIVGAGLMAAQLAVLLGTRLDVPVAMREVDEDRAEAGRRRVRELAEQTVARGRLDEAAAHRLVDRVQVGTDLAALAGADLVIEAVTEVLDVKRAVFADLEQVVRPDCVLATNTSALSVTAMADGLAHPERVVGLHFFNPVAQMPLVEVVATPESDARTLATGVDVARRAGKTVVRTTDRPGFVVNRVLLRMLADVLGAVEDGTPVTVADAALRPLGLPMSPFALLQLVGLPVARHVLGTLHDELGPRYRTSPGLERLIEEGRPVAGPGATGLPEVDPAIQDAFGPDGAARAAGSAGTAGASSAGSGAAGPGGVVGAGAAGPGGVVGAGTTSASDGTAVLERVARGLAEEVGLLLDEGVVAGPEQVDLAMLLGAGWPPHLGGICPYLDRAGWSEAVLGRRLLPPGMADAAVPKDAV